MQLARLQALEQPDQQGGGKRDPEHSHRMFCEFFCEFRHLTWLPGIGAHEHTDPECPTSGRYFSFTSSPVIRTDSGTGQKNNIVRIARANGMI